MTTAPAAPAQKPAKLPREQDPRNPNFRLAAFFDEGTLELITEDDGSGMLAAVGKVAGTHVVAFCSDATVMGGAMGEVGCKVVVHAYERALADQAPIVGLWHSGGARLAARLPVLRRLHLLRSEFGHDAFLKESAAIGAVLDEALRDALAAAARPDDAAACTGIAA